MKIRYALAAVLLAFAAACAQTPTSSGRPSAEAPIHADGTSTTTTTPPDTTAARGGGGAGSGN